MELKWQQLAISECKMAKGPLCPAGDMFCILDRAHTLHFRSGFWDLVLPFLAVAAEAVGRGNPRSWHFHISIRRSSAFRSSSQSRSTCNLRVSRRAMGTVEEAYDSNDHIHRQQTDAFAIQDMAIKHVRVFPPALQRFCTRRTCTVVSYSGSFKRAGKWRGELV